MWNFFLISKNLTKNWFKCSYPVGSSTTKFNHTTFTILVCVHKTTVKYCRLSILVDKHNNFFTFTLVTTGSKFPRFGKDLNFLAKFELRWGGGRRGANNSGDWSGIHRRIVYNFWKMFPSLDAMQLLEMKKISHYLPTTGKLF